MSDPFGLTQQPTIDVDAYAKQVSQTWYDSIQNATEATARSRQAQRRVIGVSNLGHCRQFLKYMILDQPDTDTVDKTPAFIGTVLGDAIEEQIAKDHPDWLIQTELEFPLPSGGHVKGHSDVIIPASAAGTVEEWEASQAGDYDGPPVYLQSVLDGKSKAELETIKKYGQTLQQKYQLHAYARAAIEAGHLDPSKPIMVGNVFFDRSGRDVVPYGIFQVYDESVIYEIDEWVSDVTYAVTHDEEAPRDKPRDFCVRFCPFFTVCRGTEEAPTGLIEDENIIQAVGLYAEGAELESRGKKLKKLAKEGMEGVEGNTGEYTIRNTYVGPTEIAAFTRAGYTKTEVRKVPKKKQVKK